MKKSCIKKTTNNFSNLVANLTNEKLEVSEAIKSLKVTDYMAWFLKKNTGLNNEQGALDSDFVRVFKINDQVKIYFVFSNIHSETEQKVLVRVQKNKDEIYEESNIYPELNITEFSGFMKSLNRSLSVYRNLKDAPPLDFSQLIFKTFNFSQLTFKTFSL